MFKDVSARWWHNSLTLANKASINEVFKVLEKYGTSSGAKVNKDKSEILYIGIGILSDLERQDFQIKYWKVLLKSWVFILDQTEHYVTL